MYKLVFCTKKSSSLVLFFLVLYKYCVFDTVLVDTALTSTAFQILACVRINKQCLFFRLSPFIPKGKCEIYRGTSCGSLLEGKEIYVDPFMSQAQMEQQISFAFSYIRKSCNKNCFLKIKTVFFTVNVKNMLFF